MTNSALDKYGPVAALVTVQVLFGINYVTSKIIIGSFPPLVWASIRIIVSAISLCGIALLAKRKAPPLSRRFVLSLIGFSLLGVVLNQGAFLLGLRYTTASNSAVLNTLIPVFTLVLVTLTGKESLSGKRAVGFLFAFIGVLVIRKIENFTLSDQTFIGDSLTVLNCLSYSLFLTFSKKFLEKQDPLWMTALLFSAGSLGIGALSAPSWMGFHWPEVNLSLLGCMLFSIFGTTLLAYLLNLWALSRVHSSSVALFINLQPVIASFLAWMWLGEVITQRTLLAGALIFVGMLLALAPSRRVTSTPAVQSTEKKIA